MIRIHRLEAREFKLLRSVDLTFPERARILIRGPNESGKSSLFEAIFFGLFGQPLVTEMSRGRLDDVIHYGAPEAEVTLQVSLDGLSLRIHRVVRRGRPNTASLEILGPANELRETVTGGQAVNSRVTAELGLDAEALLASCFVEQKKLDRLEGMSRAQREASLMKLLNLDRLVHMEEVFRVRPTDVQRRIELERRHALATLATELPEREAQSAVLQRRVHSHEALAALDTAIAARGRADAIRQALQGARDREAAAAGAAATAASIAAGLAAFEAATSARRRALEAERAASDAAERARELVSRATADPAELGTRLRALRRLARRVACLEEAQAAHRGLEAEVTVADDNLAAVAVGREALNRARRDLVAAVANAQDADEHERELGQDLRGVEVADALAAWARLDDEQAAVAGRGEAAALIAGRRQAAAKDFWLWSGSTAAVVLAAVAAVGSSRGASGPGTTAIVVALAALAAIALAVVSRRKWHAWQHLVAESARSSVPDTPEAGRQQDARRQEVRRRLAAANAALPNTAERLKEVRAELEAHLAGRTRESLTAEREQAVRSSAQAAGAVDVIRAREEALARDFGSIDAAAMGAARDVTALRLTRMAAFETRLMPRVAAAAARLGADAVPAAIARALGAVEEALTGAGDTQRAGEALQLEQEGARDRAAAAWAEAEHAWNTAGTPNWDREANDDAWVAAHAGLSNAYATAGGAAADAALRAALQATARLGAQADTEDRARQHAFEQARALLVHTDAMDDPSAVPNEAAEADLAGLRAAVASTLPGLPPEHADEARAALDRTEDRVRILRYDVARLETELGLRAEDLDAAAAGRDAEAFTRELEVRGRAADMVEEAARSVVQAVLPSTLDYLRRLLPRLTGHRYFDARLTDDYHIEVWDDLAGDWRRKAIFSGGAKDQFSLALRLSFALATLPEERGSAPGFLFLDEPLGSFDADRAAALIAVLTEGEVAESFDQVFLVSHVPVGDGLFDYRITMADGQVVEADLPRELPPAGA